MAAAQSLNYVIGEYRHKGMFVINMWVDSEYVLHVALTNYVGEGDADVYAYVYATNEYNSRVIADSGVCKSWEDCGNKIDKQTRDSGTRNGIACDIMLIKR